MLRVAPRRSERRPRRGPEREEEDTGSLTRAWLSCAPPPSSTTTPSKKNEEVEGRGSLTRTALAAAVGCVDSLISGRRARSVRSTPSGSPMRAALIRSTSTSVRPPAVGCVRSLFCASLPPSATTSSQLGAPPPAIERMRDDARARGWPGVGTGSTPRQGTERREEVEGRGSLTHTALAAVVRCVDSLISGRQARSVRSTPSGSTIRAALIRSASTSVRPPAVGCVCSLSCASLQPSSSTNRQAGCPPPPAG
ncbi:hypothetical protein EVAR_32340_1 [Eumeta japonica]|uniref:Uncharacterized protein n=1 Tax=Eumeta variegata TaxID=151549 RepID=A0A4C1ZCA7_EUMVA|nr:hypothetical protein EVAR_32340_1 [Eumeta japonica]